MVIEELTRIAKSWYAEQRGRTNGNTKAWDDLSHDQKLNILDSVENTLENMKEAWQWTPLK